MPYLEQLGEMLEREERGTVYNYLMWRVVMELMPYLPLRSSATSKLIYRRAEHQSKKPSSKVKLTRIHSDTSINTKKKNPAKKREK